MRFVLIKLALVLFLCTLSCSHFSKSKTTGMEAISAVNSPAQTEVIIIGAGLSGMAAAYELKKAGVPYHILELTPRAGGRVRTVQYQFEGETLVADSGMEEYWESNPAVALLKELGLPLRHDIALSSIVLGGKLYSLGDEDAAAYYSRIFNADQRRLLQSFKEEVAPLMNSLASASLAKLKDQSFADWTGRKLQELASKNSIPRASIEKVAHWIRISVECEIGTEWNRISALDGLAEFHIFLGHAGTGEESYRVIGGNENFTSALARAVGEEHITFNAKVNRIIRQGTTSTVSYLNTTNNKHAEIRGDFVISTIPLYRLFELQIEPPLSPAKWAAIQSQKWGSYFKAHILVGSEAKRFWMNGNSSSLPILSDSPLGVIYDGNPDQATKTKILSLLITGSQAEAFNFMPLDQVREIIKAQFEMLWPGFSKEIKMIEFYRYHPRAIAAWPVGRSRFDDLSNEIRRPENGLYMAGDFTESSHSDGAFISASRVVKQILQKRGNK